MWLSVGGTQALASYGRAPGPMGRLEDVPPEHWAFLDDDLADWHETDTHLFVHAGLDPGLPMDEQTELMLFWEFLNPEWGYQHVSGKTVVCGHTSQRSGQVLDLGSTVCIDTYAYGGGWLTCLDVHARRYWQADVMGRAREGWLEPREDD
jgi:serine/threonine protein phosphatase 1